MTTFNSAEVEWRLAQMGQGRVGSTVTSSFSTWGPGIHNAAWMVSTEAAAVGTLLARNDGRRSKVSR